MGRQFCGTYYTATGFGTMILLYLVEIGMQFRVYALYDGSKRILYVNGALFLLEAAAQTVLLSLDRKQDLHSKSLPCFCACL